jgi:hypothetical protein
VREGIAVVDEDRVDAVLARPAGDRGHDGVVVADLRAASTRPSNSEPMMLSCTKSSPILSRPLPASCAMRAEVPVPHGERSIALSP